MALIVEDGTMPDGANAYCGLDFAASWLADRGHSDWPDDPGSEAARTAALIRAADYLNGLGWSGRRAAPGRAMAWPRIGASDSDGGALPAGEVPYAVKAANAYLASLAHAGTDLQPVLERGGRIQSERVDTLQTTYFEDAPARDVFLALADLLRGLAVDLGAARSGGSSIVSVST